jgi:CheY-like chemotaxis protein
MMIPTSSVWSATTDPGWIRSATAETGRNALESVQKQPPDLIILDLMLPDVDGMEVCRILRQREPSRRIPIVMLTARSEEIDRVIGFELGADDYVMKPFSPRELILRVKSIFRRMKDERSDMLRVGNVQISRTPAMLRRHEFDCPHRERVRPSRTHARARERPRVMADGQSLGHHGGRSLEHWIPTFAAARKLGDEGSHGNCARGLVTAHGMTC